MGNERLCRIFGSGFFFSFFLAMLEFCEFRFIFLFGFKLLIHSFGYT